MRRGDGRKLLKRTDGEAIGKTLGSKNVGASFGSLRGDRNWDLRTWKVEIEAGR